MHEEGSRRGIGRPRSIDREKIIAAAHLIGATNLTMRAIADHLGVTTQALYNHIGGRRELLTLMANDHHDLFSVDAEEESWQRILVAFGLRMRDHLARHPGLAAAVVTRGPTSPTALQFLDHAVGLMAAEGFDEQDALRGFRSVLEMAVCWAVRDEHRVSDPGDDQMHRSLFYDAVSRSEIDSLRYLAQIAAGWNRRDDGLFEYALDALVSGLAPHRAEPRQVAPLS